MRCMFESVGIIDRKTKEFSYEKLMKKVPEEFEEMAKGYITACSNPVGANNCETAFWFNNCWRNYDAYVRNIFKTTIDDFF